MAHVLLPAAKMGSTKARAGCIMLAGFMKVAFDACKKYIKS